MVQIEHNLKFITEVNENHPIGMSLLALEKEMQIEMRSLALYKSRFDTQIEIQSWGSMVWARGATALALTELTKTIIVEGH